MVATRVLPRALYRAASVRALDRRAIEHFAMPGITLMERAGAAALGVLRATWPGAKRIVVVCGHGNNGGDGFVIGRLARKSGLDVEVQLVGAPNALRGEAAIAYQSLLETGLAASEPDVNALAGADVLVDALLGTGIDRVVAGKWLELIVALNATRVPVMSIDIPSGLHADTGRAMGVAVRAAATISFIGLKRGLLTGEGRDHCGELWFSDLDIPPATFDAVAADAGRIELLDFHDQLSPRARDAHKGQHGHVLVIGGDHGFSGAVRMAAEAAARVGAGLVSVATRGAHGPAITGNRPELMIWGVETGADLDSMLARANVAALGPGLGQASWGEELMAVVLSRDLPLVLDADALNLVAKAGVSAWPDHRRTTDVVMTPHPGEAARLLGTSTGSVEADRFEAVARIAQRFGTSVVLKGSGTLVCDRDGAVDLCSAGNPGMATGGMGDVLTGVIAGLIAQRLDGAMAARLGVCVHAEAADRAAIKGERGMLAGDVIDALREVVNPT